MELLIPRSVLVKTPSQPRVFHGKSDTQRITIFPLQPFTEISVSYPVDFAQDTSMCFEGPRDQLDFLYPFLKDLTQIWNQSYADTKPGEWYEDEDADRRWWGMWTHVEWRQALSMTVLWYRFGGSRVDRMELLHRKLQRDLVFHENIRLSETSLLEMMYFGKVVFTKEFGLPEESKNGTIVFPDREKYRYSVVIR